MNEQTISLDLRKAPVPAPVLYLGQGDRNGTVLHVDVYDNGEAFDLAGYSVRLCIRQPQAGGYYEVEGTASGSTATFEIDEQYAAVKAGVSDVAYMQVLSGDAVIASTARFQVVVLLDASHGVDPTQIYTNGVEEFIQDAQVQLENAIVEGTQQAVSDLSETTDRAEAAIAAMGDISEIAVPLMTSDIRGGAKLGAGLQITDGALETAPFSPNLFPFFSEYRPMNSTNNEWYWQSMNNAAGMFTFLEGGWVHYERNAAANAAAYWSTVAQDFVEPGAAYTLMVELRNVEASAGTVFIRPRRTSSGSQFVGSISEIAIVDIGAVGDGIIYLPIVAKGSGNYTLMLYSDVFHSVASSASFDMRVSLYKGDYNGLYQPFVYPKYDVSPNLFALSAIPDDNKGCYLNGSGAVTAAGTAAYEKTTAVSDWIPVVPGTWYAFSTDIGDDLAQYVWSRCSSYDADKNFVKTIEYNTPSYGVRSKRGNWLCPDGVAYVRLSARGLVATETYPAASGSVMFAKGRICTPWAPAPADVMAALGITSASAASTNAVRPVAELTDAQDTEAI